MRNFVFNEAMKLRRQTLVKLAKLQIDNNLKAELPKLNKTMLPGPNATYRDSLYHEREVLMQRIKLYLGLDYEKTKEFELFEIAAKYEEIVSSGKYSAENKFVQVIKEACDACPSGKYYATDLCRNCVAHSCRTVCPKDAITIEGGRAKIKPELCVGCGLCAKACNYFAIVKLERPCERACHVKALKSDKNSAAEIDREKCVSCASCYVACPFGAIETPSSILKVLEELKNGLKLNIIYAPSITAQFGPKVQTGQVKSAFYKAGFNKVYEAAVGADKVAEEEAEFIEKSDELVTTSCCPAFVEYIEKHQSDFKENISPAPSPMAEVAREIKIENEKTVFVGPCIAKKMEAYKIGTVDYVLTFEECAVIFIAMGIEPSQFENMETEGSFDGWNFAQSGGVARAVENICNKKLTIEKMNGISEGKELFKKAKLEKIDLIEGMACEGGCICGPGIMVNPNSAKIALQRMVLNKG